MQQLVIFIIAFGFATTRKKTQEKSVAHQSRTVFSQTILGNMVGDAAGNLWFYWVISPNHKKKTQPQTFFLHNSPFFFGSYDAGNARSGSPFITYVLVFPFLPPSYSYCTRP
jgi:hypothetical protein